MMTFYKARPTFILYAFGLNTFNSQEILIDTSTGGGADRKLIDYRTTSPKAYNVKKVPANVWNFSQVRYRMGEYEERPTQKLEKLLERIIKASSNKDDLILEAVQICFLKNVIVHFIGKTYRL